MSAPQSPNCSFAMPPHFVFSLQQERQSNEVNYSLDVKKRLLVKKKKKKKQRDATSSTVAHHRVIDLGYDILFRFQEFQGKRGISTLPTRDETSPSKTRYHLRTGESTKHNY